MVENGFQGSQTAPTTVPDTLWDPWKPFLTLSKKSIFSIFFRFFRFFLDFFKIFQNFQFFSKFSKKFKKFQFLSKIIKKNLFFTKPAGSRDLDFYLLQATSRWTRTDLPHRKTTLLEKLIVGNIFPPKIPPLLDISRPPR